MFLLRFENCKICNPYPICCKFYKHSNCYFLRTRTSVSAVETSYLGTIKALCEVETLSDVWQLMCLREFIALC